MSNTREYGYLTGTMLIFSLATICVSITLKSTNIQTSTMIWFWSAGFWSLTGVIFLRVPFSIKELLRDWHLLLLFGFGNCISITLWFIAVNQLGPNVTEFVSKSYTIFVILMGVILLKEHYNRRENIGILIALFGVGLLSYSKENIVSVYVLMLIFGTFLEAATHFLAKKFHTRLHPLILTTVRAWFMLIALTLYTFITHSFVRPAQSSIPIFIIVPLFSAVLAHVLMFKAYKKVDLGKAGMILTLKPFVVVVLTFIVFQELPHPREFIGGVLLVLGVLWMLCFKTVPGELYGRDTENL